MGYKGSSSLTSDTMRIHNDVRNLNEKVDTDFNNINEVGNYQPVVEDAKKKYSNLSSDTMEIHSDLENLNDKRSSMNMGYKGSSILPSGKLQKNMDEENSTVSGTVKCIIFFLDGLFKLMNTIFKSSPGILWGIIMHGALTLSCNDQGSTHPSSDLE